MLVLILLLLYILLHPYFSVDFFQHAGVSLLLYMFFYYISRNAIFALIGALSIGIFKELTDSFIDFHDIIGDLLGILIAIFICSYLRYKEKI